jgi:hypothetical protein
MPRKKISTGHLLSVFMARFWKDLDSQFFKRGAAFAELGLVVKA